MAEILNWTALQCEVGEPGQSRRRVAPMIDAAFDGLTFCSTTSLPPMPDDGQSRMVLYGPDDAGDPYDGSMIGVLWNPADTGGHGGDGDAEAVTVRGEPGVAAPITVFQQTILPELGTVIAWTEGDWAIGLYGRGWSRERVDELLAIADRLEEVDDGFRLPAEALPDGYSEVFSGNPSVTSLVLTPSPLYSVRYQSAEGLLDVTGMQMTAGEFEAFRFFTVGVDEGVVGGRDGLLGNAWGADGPAVVTWRESDGLVIRIVGLGVASAVRNPDEISAADAVALYQVMERVARAAGAAKLLLAKRVDASGEARRRGFRTTAELLAKLSGSSLGAAKGDLETSEALDDLPDTKDASLGGDVSPEQGKIVVGAAKRNPGAERQLITKAKTANNRELQEEAQKVKARPIPTLRPPIGASIGSDG